MSETRTSLLIEPKEAIDPHWSTSLQGIEAYGAEIYTELKPAKAVIAERIDAFRESGHTVDIDLRAEGIDEAELHRRENELLALKRNIIEHESDKDLRNVYRWRINELIANVRMLRASANGDMRSFERYNTYIYGKPNVEIFRATADWFCTTAEELQHSDDAHVREAASDVLTLIGHLRGDMTKLIPEPQKFQEVRESHFRRGGYFALLLADVALPDKGTVKPEVGEPALEQVKRNIGLDGYGFRDSSSWGISHVDEVVQRPVSYSMPVKRFIGLGAGHEIGSHGLERVNGLRQSVRLLGLGLDRYEVGNEGRALIREQVPYETFDDFSKLLRWQDVMRRHFAISLGFGLDEKPKSYHEVWAVINAIDRLWEISKKPDDFETAVVKADKRTTELCNRVLKGTDGKGGAYLKDKVYLEGNVACWGVDPGLIEKGDEAKTDMTNPRHISSLQKFGVLPMAA